MFYRLNIGERQEQSTCHDGACANNRLLFNALINIACAHAPYVRRFPSLSNDSILTELLNRLFSIA
jgi:hypothetical protein